MKAQVKLWQRNSQLPHFHTLVFSKSIFAKGREKHEVVKRSVRITFQLRFLFCRLNVCDRRQRQNSMYSHLAFVVAFFLLFHICWFSRKHSGTDPKSVEKTSLWHYWSCNVLDSFPFLTATYHVSLDHAASFWASHFVSVCFFLIFS